MNTNIELGVNAEDIITGLKGVLVNKVEELSGNVRYAFQPRSEDGKGIPDAFEIDYHTIIVLDDGIKDKVIKAAPSQVIPLGSVCKHKYSSVRGVVIRRVTHFNGCVHYGMVPDKGGMLDTVPKMEYLSELQIVVVHPEVQVVKVEKPRGGPATKAVRY